MALCTTAAKGGVRKCGYSCPWHPLQFVVWAFIILFTGFHYGFAAFYVPGYWRVAAFVFPGLVLTTHAVCTIATSCINPAEPGVRDKHMIKTARAPFDHSVHKYAFEKEFCNICEVFVSENSKHCRQCDKCVTDFDHHCFWLNTCIGSRNYRWFFATLVSALIGAVFIFCVNAALFIIFFADRGSLRYDCANLTNLTAACDATLKVFSVSVPDPVFPTLTAVMFLLAALAIGLVGYLTTFHIYLIVRGISTYDYIIGQRDKEQKKKSDKKSVNEKKANGNKNKCVCLKKKGNMVNPSDEELAVGGGRGEGEGRINCTSVTVDKKYKYNLKWVTVTQRPMNTELTAVESGSSLPSSFAAASIASAKSSSTASAGEVVIDMDAVVTMQKSASQFPLHLRPTPSTVLGSILL